MIRLPDADNHDPTSTTALLAWLVWPAATPRRQRYGLARLQAARLVEGGERCGGPVLQLGRRGAQVLGAAGIPARYRPLSGETAAGGVLRAGTFVAALARWLASAPHAREVRWSAHPFTGAMVRPDGRGTIVWRPQPSDTPLVVLPWQLPTRPISRI